MVEYEGSVTLVLMYFQLYLGGGGSSTTRPTDRLAEMVISGPVESRGNNGCDSFLVHTHRGRLDEVTIKQVCYHCSATEMHLKMLVRLVIVCVCVWSDSQRSR